MPYGDVIAYRNGNQLTIQVELPDHGELSDRGFGENLVNPRTWWDLEDEVEPLGIKVAVYRPLSRRRGRFYREQAR